MLVECQKVSNELTVSPKKNIPTIAPTMKNMPSILKVATATRDVPGQ